MNTYTDPSSGYTLAHSEGIIFPVTTCCLASGKGSMGSATGVVCRGCYVDVETFYGMGWTLADFRAEWHRYSDTNPNVILAALTMTPA